jgi:ribosome biogenesis GTPase
MKGQNKKPPRSKDLTDRYMDGSLDEDRVETVQRFNSKSKNLQRDKTLRTTAMRAEQQAELLNPEVLPIGQVTQVYSQYCEVDYDGRTWLCVVRKTLGKNTRGDLIVGDRVRLRDLAATDESGQPEAVIEQILPRTTVLTRADSFKQIESHPIVANAEQMLIVASAREPDVKWSLIDRMLIAAKGGGLSPVLCLNKVDLLDSRAGKQDPLEFLSHYTTLGILTLQTSIIQNVGLDQLRQVLQNRITVLAGHSGVGKSSLIRAIEPDLDIRIAPISGYTGKGRHTTTSARRYVLKHIGGEVIDTPGVKLFGLWGVTRENLIDHFPDVADGTAPGWRQESYQRIEASLAE